MSGGVAILIRNGLAHRPLSLTSNLQIIAIQVTSHTTYSVCSLYLPPSSVWSKHDIEDVIAQLPPPVLLLGDFNAHSYYGDAKIQMPKELK